MMELAAVRANECTCDAARGTFQRDGSPLEQLVLDGKEEAPVPLLRTEISQGTSVPSSSGAGATRSSAARTMDAPFIVRSYSTADPMNEAFTVTHELDFDDWMSKMIGSLQFLLSSSVVILGIYLLLTCPEMSTEGPLLYYFVIFSLSAELTLLLVICLLMLTLRLLCGRARAEYSSALCGIFHRAMEGAIYFLCVGFGASLLLLLANGDSHDPRVRYLRKRQEYVWAFVGVEVALCLLYGLQTVPTLYGICKFASHKLYVKVTGRDELEFQRGDVPIAYARLSDYDYSLQHMHNPAARMAAGGAYSGPSQITAHSKSNSVSIQMPGSEQPQRSSVEAPLMADRS